MPFNEAKQIVEKKVAPKIEKKDLPIKVAYNILLDKFTDQTKKAAKYLAYANYPEHNNDKQNYLAQIRKSTDGFLKKEGKLDEFLKYIVNVDNKSDKLHETFAERIKQQEKIKFEELSKENIKLSNEAKFDDAINNMLALNMHLSPFSRTDQSGNIGESFLRLDKKIEEKVNNLKAQKKLHSQLFVKGNVLETKNAKILIQGTAEGGQVKYADIKGKKISELKPEDYKSGSWLAILREFPLGKFELKRGDKTIDIKTDPKLAESNAQIAELKLLKQINFFYSGGLEKFAKSPEEKKLLKAALEENLATMGLYFDRNADGTVTPTEIYKMLPQPMKVKKLVGMMQGFQRIRMRMVLEEKLGKIDKEKNPSQHRFLAAEVDFQNGLHLSAYTKFKKYIKDNKNSEDETVRRQVKLAKGRLRQSSSYVIDLAERYSMACIQEPHGSKEKFHLSDGLRIKVIKKLSKVFDQLRKSMQSGKASDLDEAYAQLKDKPEGGLDVKVEEFGARGITETNFLRKHYSFIKTMITTVTFLTGTDRQEESLEIFGDRARKDKFRGGARVLYEENMKRKLIERRRELMKDPKYREKERQRFLAHSTGSNGKAGIEEVANMFSKSLEKKYPTLMRGAKAVGKTINAVTDLFAKEELFIEKKPEKEISKYEDLSPFAPTAGIMRRAVHNAGGLAKYQRLPLAKKKEFYESARMKILLAQHANNEHERNVKAYVKSVMSKEGDMSKSTNPIAYKFNDAFDPNNEFFNLSDEGWDFVESLVGEIPIMAASGGVGNLASLGVKQGMKYASKKLAETAFKRALQSAAFRLGVRGTAFVADLAVSEVIDRGMRYITRGEKPPMDIAQLLAHSIGTYGSMKYASKGGQRLLSGVAEKGMAGKIASHVISTAAIEAPCMMAVNNLFGQSDGTMLEQYGRALGTMLASKVSMSMLHTSTGHTMLKAEQDYDVKENLQKVKDPWKKKVLDEMVNKNEINTDQLSTILQSDLKFNQITKLRSLINNPQSKSFVVAYEYAKSHGIDNQDLTHQYNYLIAQMVEEGLSREDSHKLLNNLNESTVGVKAKGLEDRADTPTKPLQAAPRADTPTKPLNARHRADTPIKPLEAKPALKRPKLVSKPTEGTPVNEVSQKRLDDLAAKLKKIGLDDFAYLVAEPNVDNVPLSMLKERKEIQTLEQRQKLVDHLIEMDAKIKSETDFLRDAGLIDVAKTLENYKDTSEYKTMDKRLESAQEIGKGVEMLSQNGIPFKPENAVRIIELFNGTSKEGKVFRQMLVDRITAEFANNPDRKVISERQIEKTLTEVFGKIDPALKAKILDLSSKKLMTPEDRAIAEANKANMTPELMQAIVVGGKEFTAGGKTVRIYTGAEVKEGGLATVNDVWFVQKPSSKLEKGVVKVPKPDATMHFGYESDVAGGLTKVLNDNPSEASNHVIKPLFASNDIIIYKKVTDSQGKTTDLHDAMQTMNTKDWLAQFTGGLKGLAYLHANGITHNDFKPANIVVGKNGGVIIDIGSFVFKSDIGSKIITERIKGGGRGAFFKKGTNLGGLGSTEGFHDPTLLAHSIDKNKPLNLGDKYAVGTSLLHMLTVKGYATQKVRKIHKFNLKDGGPEGVKKLYELGQKLMDAQNHPYEFKNNDPKNGKDPGYVSIDNVVAQIKQISSTLPAQDNTSNLTSPGQSGTTLPLK